jgi:hypothetical protein
VLTVESLDGLSFSVTTSATDSKNSG